MIPAMVSAFQIKPNGTKLKEAVHFVCKKYALQSERLGAVKLQKIIWYLDVKSFIHSQQPVTGSTFIKNEFGPFTRDLPIAIDALIGEGRLFADQVEYLGKEKARFIGKGETEKSVFSEKELRWLDEISTDVCENHTADSISERTHGSIWKMAAFGEVIPLAAAVVRLRPPSQSTLDESKKELDLV
jgi:hypothetical protein